MTDKPPVHAAWTAVMADVQAIAKGDRNQAQGFSFRGIDSVMNAVGPALRSHGVTIIPQQVEGQRGRVQTARGREAVEVVVKVTYMVIGPAGDSFVGVSFGEAMDLGDKATAKAMSVAYRTFLLQALTIPTHEPDPDSETFERGHPRNQGVQETGGNPGTPPPPRNQGPTARETCEWIIGEYAKAHGLDPKRVKADYKAAKGKVNPDMLRAWLKEYTPSQETRA